MALHDLQEFDQVLELSQLLCTVIVDRDWCCSALVEVEADPLEHYELGLVRLFLLLNWLQVLGIEIIVSAELKIDRFDLDGRVLLGELCSRLGLGLADRRRLFTSSHCYFHREYELATHTNLRELDDAVALQALTDLLTEVKPDSGSVRIEGSTVGIVRLKECIEDVQLFMSCHSNAFVKDGDFDQQKSIVVRHRLQLARTGDEALASELDRVPHDIEEHLLEPPLIK